MKKFVYYSLTFSLLASPAYAQNYTLTKSITNVDDLNYHFITNSAADNKLLVLDSNLENTMFFYPLSNGKITLDGTDKNYAIDGNGKIGFQTFSNGELSLKNLTLSNFSSRDKGGAFASSGKSSYLENVNFINNSVIGNSSAKGGAVYTDSDLTITADNFNSEFTDNYSLNADGSQTYNAIYLSSNRNLNLKTARDGSITFNDGIEGNPDHKFTMNISGDGSGEIKLNDAVKNAETINVSGTVLSLGSFKHSDGTTTTADMSGAKLSLTNSTLNLENGEMQTIHLDEFASTADVKLRVDANLANGNSDRIAAASVEESSQITLEKLNIIEDGTADITLFDFGKAPEIVNLDSFAAFSQGYKYTFDTSGDGILHLSNQESRGLNGVMDDGTLTKSYSVGTGTNVSDHLGELAGGPGASLSILGNSNVLDGNGYNGIKISEDQTLNIDETEVRNFSSALGGAVSSSGKVVLTNSSFIGNHGSKAGAVYATNDIIINADGKESLFSNNSSGPNLYSERSNSNRNANAIYLDNANATLRLNAVNQGQIIFNDRIDGQNGYGVEINGDENSSVLFNNTVAHAGEIKINSGEVRLGADNLLDGASLNLAGGKLNLSNDNIGTASIQDFRSNNGILGLDVDPVSLTADKLVVNGDLIGNSRLLINALSTAQPQNDILFAETHNDNPDTEGSFEVWRVNGSPLAWETKYDADGKDWYMTARASAGTSQLLVVPEVISYLGLHNAAFEQTRSVVDSLRHKANVQTIYSENDYSDRNYKGEPLFNLWAAPMYVSANLDSPVDFKQNLYGAEAGGDIMLDAYNRLGLFGSYRQGKYDFSGKADHFRSDKSAKINIDSYLLGVYYEYARGNLHGVASLFGGLQKADLRSDDFIRNKTDGTEFGGSAELGYTYALSSKFSLEPSIGVTRSFVKFDSISDAAGKYTSFDSAEHLEMEAAVKLEHQFEMGGNTAKAYLRPSVLRVMHRSGDLEISGLGKVNGLENAYYGRIEGGISAAVRDNLNLYCNAAYTFNGDYRQESISAGLNYAF